MPPIAAILGGFGSAQLISRDFPESTKTEHERKDILGKNILQFGFLLNDLIKSCNEDEEVAQVGWTFKRIAVKNSRYFLFRAEQFFVATSVSLIIRQGILNQRHTLYVCHTKFAWIFLRDPQVYNSLNCIYQLEALLLSFMNGKVYHKWQQGRDKYHLTIENF